MYGVNNCTVSSIDIIGYILIEMPNFSLKKMHLQCHLQNGAILSRDLYVNQSQYCDALSLEQRAQ